MNIASAGAEQAGTTRPHTRIALLSHDEMSAEQRGVYDRVIAGPRGRMIGPLLAAIHSPELAERWSSFGEFLRFGTCLPKTCNELAILVTGRYWGSQVEWWVHARAAADCGLSQQVIDAIRSCRAPLFEQESEFEIYEYARLLQQTGAVPEELHSAIKQRWGTRGVVELTAVIGYYTLVAMTLNAHEIPVPDDVPEPLPRMAARPILPKGRLAA